MLRPSTSASCEVDRVFVAPRDVMFAKEGKRAYLRRTLGDELPAARSALVRLLEDPDIAEEGPPGCFRIEDPDQALALIALGYKQADAHKAVHDLQQKGEAKSAEELVKLTLKRMAAGR